MSTGTLIILILGVHKHFDMIVKVNLYMLFCKRKKKIKKLSCSGLQLNHPLALSLPKKKKRKKKGKITKIEIADVLLSAFTFQMLFL